MNTPNNNTPLTPVEKLDLVLLTVAVNNRVKFPFKCTDTTLETPVDILQLDLRTANACGRNKIQTVGDLITSIETGRFAEIRYLGRKSLSRALYALCFWQYVNLTPAEQTKYLERLVLLNTAEEV